MDSSSQLLVCVFDGAESADEIYQALRSFDRRLDEIKLKKVAVVRKRADGQVTNSEADDLMDNNPIVGWLAPAGMLVGLLLGRMGFLGLSRGAAVALGGAAGLLAGVIMTKVHPGFSGQTLQQFGASLAAEKSAIVMVVRPSEEGYVRAKLAGMGGTFIQDTLSPETIAQLTAAY